MGRKGGSMEEREASEGTKLYALLSAMSLKVSFEVALSAMEGPPGDVWDDLASALVRTIGDPESSKVAPNEILVAIHEIEMHK